MMAEVFYFPRKLSLQYYQHSQIESMVYDLAFRDLNGNHVQCHGFYVHVT